MHIKSTYFKLTWSKCIIQFGFWNEEYVWIIPYHERKGNQIFRWANIILFGNWIFIFLSSIFALVITESTKYFLGTCAWLFKALSFFLFRTKFSLGWQHLIPKGLLESTVLKMDLKNNYKLVLQRNCLVKYLYLSCLNVIRLAINSQMIRCCYQ